MNGIDVRKMAEKIVSLGDTSPASDVIKVFREFGAGSSTPGGIAVRAMAHYIASGTDYRARATRAEQLVADLIRELDKKPDYLWFVDLIRKNLNQSEDISPQKLAHQVKQLKQARGKRAGSPIQQVAACAVPEEAHRLASKFRAMYPDVHEFWASHPELLQNADTKVSEHWLSGCTSKSLAERTAAASAGLVGRTSSWWETNPDILGQASLLQEDKRAGRPDRKDGHDLYQDGDDNLPPAILDRNGGVALAMCRLCGKAEVELDGTPCKGPASQDPFTHPDAIRRWKDAVATLETVVDPSQIEVLKRSLVLQDTCHGLAESAGWWKDLETGEDVRSWSKKHLDNWVSAKLMLVVTEVAEAMEGHRKGIKDDKLPHRGMLEVELADAIIRILDLAGGLNLDVTGAIIEKLAYNMTRADHKPENRMAAGGKSI